MRLGVLSTCLVLGLGCGPGLRSHPAVASAPAGDATVDVVDGVPEVGEAGSEIGPDGADVAEDAAPDARLPADAGPEEVDPIDAPGVEAMETLAPPGPVLPIPPPPDAAALPGGQVSNPASAGQGHCAGKTLAAVVADVQRAYPEVGDIQAIATDLVHPSGPRDRGTDIVAFASPERFALVFRRKQQTCPGFACVRDDYTYFYTSGGCLPIRAGRYARENVYDGNLHESCWKLEGEPLWMVPPAPDPNTLCSPRNISGVHRLRATIVHHDTCAMPPAAPPRDAMVAVTIVQTGATRVKGTVVFTGTGLAWLDGRELPATFKDRRFDVDVRAGRTEQPICRLSAHFRGYHDLLDDTGGFTLTEEYVPPPGRCPDPDLGCRSNDAIKLARTTASGP